ncbi:MAG: polyhydroxyalkanoic acid synthase [Proteobacteria bacterium]|nr:polyhydroxyalkanoic acid synthase [Pseudomonadota bacterium]
MDDTRHPQPEPSGHLPETPTQTLDRLVHTSLAPITGGLSPVSLGLAWADWALHLSLSPGRRMELAALAARHGIEWMHTLVRPAEGERVGEADDDPRFRDPGWTLWPFNALRSGFRHAESYWREAACTPGMTAHHAHVTRFFAGQSLDMLAPSNWIATNPVVLGETFRSGGVNLVQGTMNWLRDATGQPDPLPPGRAPQYRVGIDVAATPGQVVHRNHLVELIRYAPQSAQVHAAPLFVVPSWIMKYYILDLSPHNSLARYLVGQGHTVYMLSWRNPDAADRDLSMDDYLRLGIFDALAAIGRLHGREQPVQAMGYCLGGTLLAIAAAALARNGQHHAELPALASMTLLAAQTDFSEPGELGLFIDEGQIAYLDGITRSQGFLTGKQMAGSFQFLHSRDLVWTRRMREYLMGEREQTSDLMAWNADTTRMPARMHHEYLTALYLRNALATSSYRVDGQAVSLADVRLPIFMVGTERDHVSPWRSVYKLHHLSDAEITFVLTVGGHNAGIVSEPGHARRSYRIGTRAAEGPWIDADEWLAAAQRHEGSWWPAWHEWLAARSGPLQRARPIPRHAALGPAPGDYVMKRYAE